MCSQNSLFFILSRFLEFSPEFQSGRLPEYPGTPGCILLSVNDTSGSFNTSPEHYFLGQIECHFGFLMTGTWLCFSNFSSSIITLQLQQNGIGLRKGYFLQLLISAARLPLILMGGESNL